MPITRRFLDWNEPALPAAAEFLIDRYAKGDELDLSDVVVVVPGRRAGRRLLEILIEKTADRHPAFVPPLIETVSHLPERLYQQKYTLAPTLTQMLVWRRALQAIDSAQLRTLIPRLPDDHDLPGWMRLCRVIISQHDELSADRADFADVCRAGREVANFDKHEQARWECLSAIQAEYFAEMDRLRLWDRQKARIEAINRGECRADFDIVLVATVDVNLTLRAMLDEVSDRVTALIHAPDVLANHFDEHGCLNSEAWQDVTIPIRDDQLRVVDTPQDQAHAVIDVLAALDDRTPVDDVVIGVADATVVPDVQRCLDMYGIDTRQAVGRALNQTRPFRLLEALSNLVATASFREERFRADFDAFATFVRHPDVFAWIERARHDSDHNAAATSVDEPEDIEWLIQLDRYQTRHLQPRLGFWLGPPTHWNCLREAFDNVGALIRPLVAVSVPGQRDQLPQQPLADWSVDVLDVLQRVYDGCLIDREREPERFTLDALTAIVEQFEQVSNIPAGLMPNVTAGDAIQIVVDQLRHETIPPDLSVAAIDVMGWLELPLDDAPHLIVTPFNEGAVPTSVTSDLFLPNSLRRQLGLNDNARRYARDAYATSAILASREAVTLIVGRRNAQSDPLRPSRLLFAASADEVIARVHRFFEPSADEASPVVEVLTGHMAQPRSESTIGFAIPAPESLAAPRTRISVTEFKDYLACPYRYYLKHVLKLQSFDDSARELDARLFGILLHAVLDDFGRSEVRHALNAADIRDFLRHSLDEVALKELGRDRPAPVHVQLKQMERRLDAFARWQADWARQGWRIRFSEVQKRTDSVDFIVDEKRTIHLHGRIDRIDQFGDEDRWTIFDYKTGDSGLDPQKIHLAKGRWVDLQLPLYRHLAVPLGVGGNPQLGYIVLPRSTDTVGDRLATWDDEALMQADDVARQVAADILDGKFSERAAAPPAFSEELAPICQDNVFETGAIE